MLLNYVHGNPRPRKKMTKNSKRRNPLSFDEVVEASKDFEKNSKIKAKPKASEKKAVKKATEKAVKNQKKLTNKISDDLNKLQEGESVMAKKGGKNGGAKAKRGRMFHAKVTVHRKKTGKKAGTKKAGAKKASAKKASAKKASAKKASATKASAKKASATKASAKKASAKKASATKASAKKAGTKKAGTKKAGTKKAKRAVASVEFTSKSMPKGFKDMKKGQKRKVQLTVAPKKRNKKGKGKGATKKNPIVRSNPNKHTRFEGYLTRKNPFNKVSNAISSIEGKISSALRPLDNVLTKFVGVESMEVIGLAFGSSMDGALYNAVAKIPKSDLVLSKLPQEYKHEIVSGATGLILHGLNTLLEKKGGKGSMLLEAVSKGMILSAMVKSIAKISPMSSENAVSAPVSGLYYAPRTQMGAMVNNDFQGVDFEGVDFEGVDFEGIVTESNAMSGLVMEGDYSDSDELEMEVPDYTLAE